ncbi:unnamed protein product [Hermetia illucens]|uniref:Uncharacterized protein n=1 Tax=Hermetia illucens TaxID=343691 RepID=A0A7R8YPH3_HERIL|nr:unnamed protein product [Hermetia illucens]
MKVQTLSSDLEEKIFESDTKRILNFHVVEPMHAIVEAKNNIEIESFKNDPCGQAISVALMAVVYAEVNTSNIWDPSAIDKIRILGRRFYKKCVRDKDQFTLENIPQNIPIEHFIVTLQVLPNFVQTTWTIERTTHVHEGVTKLKGIFTETTIRNVIMQMDKKSYGIWKHNNQFYILDLYPSALMQGYFESSRMKPTLHMFDTLESLCYSLSRQVIQAPYDSTCLIHVVTVLNIQKDKNFIKESTKNMPYCGNVIERGAGKWATPSSELTVSHVQDREDLKLHLDAFDAPEKDVNNLGSHGNRSMSAKDRIFDSIKNSENCFSSTVSQMASERSTYRTSTSSGFEKKSCQSDTEEISSETLSPRARIPKLVKNESLSTKSNMNCPGHPIISLEGKRVKSEEYRCSFPTLGSMDSNKSTASSQMKTNWSTENDKIQIETLFHQSKISTHKYPVPIRKTNILEPKSTEYSRNCHPGLLRDKTNIAVIGSKTGSYESLKNLLRAGFKVTDRILAITPWRNYVIFKFDYNFFLYERCTCNAEYFRRLDLSTGTAGLLQFTTLHDAIIYIIAEKHESLNFS